jgi:hypothetical protein
MSAVCNANQLRKELTFMAVAGGGIVLLALGGVRLWLGAGGERRGEYGGV